MKDPPRPEPPRASLRSSASVSSSVPSSASSEQIPALPGDVTIPDGGLRAWLVVFGGFLDFVTAFGFMNSFSIFQVYYLRNLLPTAPVWHITWIGSVQIFILFMGGLVVGPAFDKWGARRIMIPGTIICLVSGVCTGFSTKYHHILLSQGFLFGIRNAMLYYPATSAIAEWFDRRRAFALGLAISGGSVGGIFWPIVIDNLLNEFSFARANQILVLCALPPLTLSCLLVKERDVRGHDPHGHEIQVATPTVKKELTDRNFLLLNVALFFIYFGMVIPFYYIPLYAIEVGIRPPLSNQLLAICYGGSVVGRIAAGALGDKMGRFNTLIAVGALTAILNFAWISWTSLAGQVVFAVAFGLASGGIVPLGAACVAQTTTNLGRIGLRIGAMMAFCAAGTLVSGPLGGLLKETRGHWIAVHSFSAGTVILGVLLLVWSRLRWEPRWFAVV